VALIDDFKARFSQFNSDSVDNVFPFLEKDYIYYYNFPYVEGGPKSEIILFLLAFLYKVEKSPSDGQKNQVRSASAKGVSSTFNVSDMSTEQRNFLNSNDYGQRFLRMANRRQGTFFV
jgi:hypothetical protein